MSFADIQAKHVRLTILRLLAEGDADYSANDSIIADALPHIGFTVGRDRVRAEIEWLRDSGLLKVETVESLLVATLSQRGLDVAQGRVTVTGVKRPAPDA